MIAIEGQEAPRATREAGWESHRMQQPLPGGRTGAGDAVSPFSKSVVSHAISKFRVDNNEFETQASKQVF